MPRSRILLRLALAAGVVGLLAAGCGSDDGGEESSADTTAEATTTTADTTAEFCDASETINLAATAGPDIDFETATEEEIGAAFVELLEGLSADFETLTATAPDEAADDVAAFSEGVDEAIAAEDPSLFEDEEFQASADAVFATSTETCEWTPAAVSGIDYAFEGIPATVAGGLTAITFTNAGDEPHEMVLFAKGEGVTESFDDLLALPEEEVGDKVVPVGGVSPIEAGDSDTALVDLEPGEYMAICFLPVGGGDEGPPHFLEGMKSEFTVE